VTDEQPGERAANLGEGPRLAVDGEGVVRADHVDLHQGGAAAIEADTVTMSQGGASRISAREVSISQGGAAVVRADHVRLGPQAGAFAIAADRVDLAEGSRAFLVLARSRSGGGAVVLDAPRLLAILAGLLLLRGLLGRTRGR
jgi:hypothetical protein